MAKATELQPKAADDFLREVILSAPVLENLIQTELVPAIKADAGGMQLQTAADIAAMQSLQNAIVASTAPQLSIKDAITSLNIKLDQSIAINGQLVLGVASLVNSANEAVTLLKLLMYPIPSMPGAFGFVVNNV